MFGVRQSGDLEFRLGDIYTDATVLKNANDAAKSLTEKEYEEIISHYPAILDKISNFASGTL